MPMFCVFYNLQDAVKNERGWLIGNDCEQI